MAFTIVEAPYAVPVLFGDEWTAAVLPMQILAVTGMRQSVQSTTSPLLIALGKTRLLVRFGGGSMLVYAASFFVGVQWSIAAVAACYAVVDFLIAPVVMRISGRLLAFSARDYLTVLVPAAVASTILAGTAEAAVLLLEGAEMPIGITLAVSSFVGLLSFLAAVRYWWPDEISNLKSRLKASRD
jgi:O-antigen/teichoic acid export membrane protein